MAMFSPVALLQRCSYLAGLPIGIYRKEKQLRKPGSPPALGPLARGRPGGARSALAEAERSQVPILRL